MRWIVLLLLALMGPAGAVVDPFNITVTVGGSAYLSAVNTLNSLAGSTIPSGGSAVLTWDSTNGATSCTGTGFSTGNAVSGTATVSPTTTTTYSVTCGTPGATASTTVTVSGTLRTPATDGSCTNRGGGSGTGASPWHAACIQFAVSNASPGDTIFLAAGNWVLDTTADTASVVIDKIGITLVGAGSGNTFDTWGHVNNPQPTSPTCPTTSSNITCVYQSGKSYAYGTCPGFGTNTCPGSIIFGNLNDLSTDSSCANETVTHIFFDGSKTTAGGGIYGLLVFLPCAGPINVNDLRFIAGSTLAVGGGGISAEPQFFIGQSFNANVYNSLFADPFQTGGYSGAQVLQSTGPGGTVLMQNNVIYQGAFNPIFYSNVNFVGNQQYDYVDSNGGSSIDPGAGYSGTGLGGPAPGFCPQTGQQTGECHGDVNLTLTNNLWYGPGNTFAIGGGVNDPSTSGGLNNLSITGNWIIADTPAIDSCTFHLFSDQGNCSPGNAVGMAINVAVDNSCNESNAGTPFTIVNNSLKGVTAAYLIAKGSVSTSGTAPSDWINCKFSDGATVVTVPIRVYGFSAQKNWLSSSSNQYQTNSNAFSPVQSNNFCTPAVGTVTGCATTGFTTPPTVSFTLGTLSNGVVQFASTSFTAQYGAVQWLASTNSTPPTASDSRWSSNNASFPNSAANSYVPPVSLSGVTHGSTVYMWVMDSANNISATASALLP